MKFLEDDLQMAVCKYLDSLNLVWTHVANERKTSKIAGARLKRKGVKSGVLDCLIFTPNKNYSGLAIELKVGKNKPTENQIKWMEKLQKCNWKTEVCYSIDEVIKVVSEYVADR